MTVGYLLRGPDNGSDMLGGDMRHRACPTCGMSTDREWIDPSFKLGMTDLDASYTYDGYLIVSERFRSLAPGQGVRFIELPSAPGFYSLVVDNIVPFDAAR